MVRGSEAPRGQRVVGNPAEAVRNIDANAGGGQEPPRPRSREEILALKTPYKKEDRAAWTKETFVKIHKEMTAGLINKFSMVSIGNDANQFENIYGVTMRVYELEDRLRYYDMREPFLLANPSAEAPHLPGNDEDRIDLLRQYSEVSLDRVLRSARWYAQYGDSKDFDSSSWAELLLKNSCDTMLHDKVVERMMTFDELERGGPTFFYVMMDIITAISDEAARTLTTKITMLKLTDLDGENVPRTVSFIRGAMALFKNANKMPPDMVEKICDIMKTSSVEDFNDLFKHAKRAMIWDRKEYTADELLNKAELAYKDLHNKGVWIRPSKMGTGESVFVAKPTKRNNNTVTCWNCGKPGHTNRNCPEPPKNGSTGQSGLSNQQWRKTPPGEGAPHTKRIGEKTWFWCGTCKVWNTTHVTAKHVKGAGKGGNKLSSANANVVSSQPTPGGPSASSTGRVSFAQSLQSTFASK